MNRSPSVFGTTALRWLLPVNLGVQILIVVTGGLVRLTGSGLGCPTWPQCDPGSFTPAFRPEDGIHPYIEFGNRLIGIVVGAVALAVLFSVWRWADGSMRRRMLVLAGLVLVGTLAQGVLGGVTVILGLDPTIVMAHFLISMLLIVASTLLLVTHRLSMPEGLGTVPGIIRGLAAATVTVGAVVIVLGTIVTGSGPHSGDADEPARFDFDPQTVSWLHADSVMLFVGLVVAMVVSTSLVPQATPARRPWRLVLLISLAQGVLGYVQYATGVPVPLVSLHMLGACLLTATLTWGLWSVFAKPTRISLQRPVDVESTPLDEEQLSGQRV
ncbi:MAG: COX15/CtaA family protein [Ornithinimicrobium sp.]